MKKLREKIKRIYSTLSLLFSDNYLLFTYDQTSGSKFDFEYRSNFPIGGDLISDMNLAVFSWVVQHHEKKQAEVNENTINNILKSKP